MKKKILSFFLCLVIVIGNLASCEFTLIERIKKTSDDESDGNPPQSDKNPDDDNNGDNTEPGEKCDGINHNWTFDKTIQTVSCEEDGVLTYVCDCGEAQAVIEKSIGHIFGEWEELKSATCNVLGEKQRTCKICNGKEKDFISALGHDYDIKEENANQIFDCKNCEEYFVISQDLVPDALNLKNQQLFDCASDFAFLVM